MNGSFQMTNGNNFMTNAHQAKSLKLFKPCKAAKKLFPDGAFVGLDV